MPVKNLTIDQMREIVVRAPEGATLCFCFGKTFENRVDYYKHFFNFFQMWLPDHGWFPVHQDLAEDSILLDDLRAAIAEHDQYWYGQSEGDAIKEHECYQQELIKGGVVFVGDNSKLVQAIRELDCDHDWKNRQAELKDLMQRIGPEVPNNPTSDEIEAEQIKNKNLQIKGLQNRIDKALPFLDRAYKFTKRTSCCLAILDAKEALRGEREKL